MKTNVELEFISKVRELGETMQDLADFWLENLEALEDANISKDYPFNGPLLDLALDVFDWYVELSNAYYEKMQKQILT